MCAYFPIYRYVCVCVFLVRNVFPSVCVCVQNHLPLLMSLGKKAKRGVSKSAQSLFSVLCCSYNKSGLLYTKVWGTSTGQHEHFIQTILKHSSTVVLLGKRMILCVQVCMWHCACV